MLFITKLDYYIARSFFFRFIAATFFISIICTMAATVAFLKNTDVRDGFLTSSMIILLKMPLLLEDLLPFCILLGASSCFLAHAKASEIIVMRAIGISVWRILYAPLIVTLLITIFQMTILDWLSTRAAQLNQKLTSRTHLKEDQLGTFSLSGQGIWLYEGNTTSINNQNVIVHIRTFNADKKKFYKISFFLFTSTDSFKSRLEAQEGQLLENSSQKIWRLYDVYRIDSNKPTEYLPIYELPTTLTMSVIKSRFLDPNVIPFLSLPHFIYMAKKIGFPTRDYETRFYSILFLPILTCLMLMVAAVFTLRFTFRHTSVLWNILLATLASFFIFFFRILCFTLSHSDLLPTFLGALLPAILFLFLSLWALFHLEDG